MFLMKIQSVCARSDSWDANPSGRGCPQASKMCCDTNPSAFSIQMILKQGKLSRDKVRDLLSAESET